MKLLRSVKVGLLALSLFLLCAWVSDAPEAQKKKENLTLVSSKKLDIHGQIAFDIKYKAKRGREIVVALKRNGQWMGNGVISVKKGTGTVRVPITPKNELWRSNKYEIDYYLRPVGTTWEDAVTPVYKITNIEID